MMASASEISSFSSPVRSRPNRMPTPCAVRQSGMGLRHRRIGAEDALHLPALAGGGGEHVVQIGDGLAGRLEKRRAVEHMRRAGGRRMGALLRPAVARRDEAKFAQAEIRHGARHHADILGQLRLDEDDDGMLHVGITRNRAPAHVPFSPGERVRLSSRTHPDNVPAQRKGLSGYHSRKACRFRRRGLRL